MKIQLFGPNKEDPAVAEALKYVPEGAQEVYVQCPNRNDVNRRACQLPGWLFIHVSVDNKLFIVVSQQTPTSEYKVKIT